MPVVRSLLVASLLVSQVGCRSTPRTEFRPVGVISSRDGDGTLVTDREARYQLTKLPAEEAPVGASPVGATYLVGTRPAGTVLGFEKTETGLFALSGTDRIPLESAPHRWERLDETVVPRPAAMQSARDAMARWLDSADNLATTGLTLAVLLALAAAGAAASANTNSQGGAWYR